MGHKLRDRGATHRARRLPALPVGFRFGEWKDSRKRKTDELIGMFVSSTAQDVDIPVNEDLDLTRYFSWDIGMMTLPMAAVLGS
jgi:hypothetical protein